MNKIIIALSLAVISTSAMAVNDDSYIGVKLGKSAFSIDGFGDVNGDDSASYGIYNGRNLAISEHLSVAVELEYLKHSTVKNKTLSFKAHSFGLNVTPKFYPVSKIYIAPKIGVHYAKIKFNSSLKNISDDDFGYSFGIETGYDFDNMTLKLGADNYNVADLESFNGYVGIDIRF